MSWVFQLLAFCLATENEEMDVRDRTCSSVGGKALFSKPQHAKHTEVSELCLSLPPTPRMSLENTILKPP